MILVSPDVIVVGAGPAGAFSAYHAARLGAQVEVHEEHTESGLAPHCTGHVSLAGLKQLDLKLPRNLVENEIRSAIFHSPSNQHFAVTFSSPVTCVINRECFDEYLREKALEAGVRILYNSHVRSLTAKKDSIIGVAAETRRGVEESRSKVVIDAEGVSSILLKRAGLPSLNSYMTVKGIEADVDRIIDIELDSVEVFLTRKFAPGLFAWIVPRSDGSGKIGLGTARGNPQDCLRRFINQNPIVRQRLKGSHLTRVVCHPISLGGPISKTFQSGLLIVGDAASHVKPTTGGGIVMGLIGAKIAGEVAAFSINNKFELSIYERLWKKQFGLDMAIMKRVRLLLNGLSDKKLDNLIAISNRIRLNESLRKMINIDFQGKSLIRAAKDPRVLAIGLYLSMLTLF
ncbi:MAG: NAD(P)/FAD-dependent oxidoreductase [Candidatus Bathyarchaeota archaeon]|nr:NAD(P)/FAD-dependent oxidoreductase [Candidatus Bathyarchaeota archaeon]